MSDKEKYENIDKKENNEKKMEKPIRIKIKRNYLYANLPETKI